MPAQDIVFLDSTQLKVLPKLLESVNASINYVLLLSRKVLRRPWVLAELCRAHSLGRNVSLVLIDYPGRENDPKSFRFPQDLDAVISEWSIFIAHLERGASRRDHSQLPSFLAKSASTLASFRKAPMPTRRMSGGTSPNSLNGNSNEPPRPLSRSATAPQLLEEQSSASATLEERSPAQPNRRPSWRSSRVAIDMTHEVDMFQAQGAGSAPAGAFTSSS
uniref:TIR domain-containing protein n=1 Tax=Prymnesium polylepis TaxID=72548 RepID=A0A7S4J3W6_9EUKA